MDVTSATSTSTTTSSSSSSLSSVTSDDFLQLFVAQLKAQDPLNPMDSSQFTSQLAQFSSLEQLTNLNASMSDLLASQTSLQNTLATDLIGKTVVYAGDTATLDGTATMAYSLASGADSETISIYDSTGALVRTDTLSAQSSGYNSYTWDGKDQSGNDLAAGSYTFSVSATDSSGNAVSATTLSSGSVTGVGFSNGTTYLSIDGTTAIALGDVLEIEGGA